MGYVRKTSDVFEVQGNYGQGWEAVTAEDTRTEARARLREYRENEPQYPHRLVKRRERKETLCPHGAVIGALCGYCADTSEDGTITARKGDL